MKDLKHDIAPEGAISLEYIDRIYLTRLLEETGADDLIPVLNSYTVGQYLEEQGRFKDAQRLYKETLKRTPRNHWIKEAVKRVKYTLN